MSNIETTLVDGIFEDRDYGFKYVDCYTEVALTELTIKQEYQRAVEPTRLKRLITSIKEVGYLPHEIIIINDSMQVIDGQHRVIAARHCGYEKIPACMISFPSEELEAKFFADKNNWNTTLKPVDFWNARYLSGNKLAVFIYRLEGDKYSLFYNKIAIKGKQTNKIKFNICDVILIINSSVFNTSIHWDRRYDELLNRKVSQVDYFSIRDNTNTFLEWFYNYFGSSKEESRAYDMLNIRVICNLFCLLKEQGFLDNQTSKKLIERKLQTFNFSASFLREDPTAKLEAMKAHINKGKHKERNRIK